MKCQQCGEDFPRRTGRFCGSCLPERPACARCVELRSRLDRAVGLWMMHLEGRYVNLDAVEQLVKEHSAATGGGEEGMGSKSKIEWCDATWNPMTGCTKVSAGCKNCYAERMVGRGEVGRVIHGSNDFGKVALHPDRLDHPLHWRKPRRVFVCSMGDLFHQDVPDEFIARVWRRFIQCPRHTFLVLTKRPGRMLAWLTKDRGPVEFPTLRNVWLGVSAENQNAADERIPLLLQTPAAVRFVSVEPMLGPVSLYPFMVGDGHDMPYFRDGALHWVICGGESGQNARPMHPDWALSLRDQCLEAGVPFLFKQWGETVHVSQMTDECARAVDAQHNLAGNPRELWRVGKKAAGRALDGVVWDQYPATGKGGE